MTDQTQAATPERVAADAPDIPSRVRAGAAWLDQHRPNWLERIDLIVLDVSDAEYCVLGQLDGHYQHNIAGGMDASAALGFFHAKGEYDAEAPGWWDDTLTEFDALNAAWAGLIEGRLTDEVRRIAAACCPCRDAVCEPGCTCKSPQCPKTEAELTE